MKALSEFADYVENQQKTVRFPPAQGCSEDHAELDMLNDLDLADSAPQARLRELLLDKSLTTTKLVELLELRLDEGHGEAIFEVGFENNGDSMAMTKDDWGVAMESLNEAARTLKADCQILLTKNVGGEFEGIASGDKDKDCHGKILIRQNPATAEEVIETRIAVVGNVDAGKSTMLGVLVKGE